jgi:SAM-dependent methyltransferase
MDKITDWDSLWRELVTIRLHSRKSSTSREQETDIWSKRAQKFDEGVKRKWAKPDSSRRFILAQLDKDSTVLDIGAGTGAWSILMAPHVKHVTAVEPSTAMMDFMRKSLADKKITNATIVPGSWPDVSVVPHDFSLCSHSIYGYPDLAGFIRQMAAFTRRMCFLLLRAPMINGIQAEAAQYIWGQPIDSPNFTIAYNILIQLGIYANVLMEDTGLWEPRTSTSLEAALNRMKRHFGLVEKKEYDEYLMDLLRRRLTMKNGLYIWPPEVRSALVYWQAGI